MTRIELRDVWVNEALSEETHCYSAILVVDGRDFACVGNAGVGGCDVVAHYFPPFGEKDMDELRRRVELEYPKLDMSAYEREDIPTDLDTVCATLVEDFLERRRLGG
jgi:hypothetical protein